MPYVNQRWLGGMLTNFQTISKRLTRLKELEELDFDDVAASGYTKKELLILQAREGQAREDARRHPHMARSLGRLDRRHQEGAPRRRRGPQARHPVIAILDTNCDPDEVDYKIPGNDDAIRSVTLLTRVIADAVADGSWPALAVARQDEGDAQTAEEPLAEWERELLGADDARAGRCRDGPRPSRPPTEAAPVEVEEPRRLRRRGEVAEAAGGTRLRELTVDARRRTPTPPTRTRAPPLLRTHERAKPHSWRTTPPLTSRRSARRPRPA
jgi:small subunit ribosomal protein S2